jgi:hypothetical protein
LWVSKNAALFAEFKVLLKEFKKAMAEKAGGQKLIEFELSFSFLL